MYVSSTAPIPQNSTSPLPAVQAARYNARKNRVMLAAYLAKQTYSCAAPVSSFQDFGTNFQYQVQRADDLLNRIGQNLSAVSAQAGATSQGTSGAPKVTPLNPVDITPKPKPQVTQPGPWDAPQWGDSATALPAICTPGQSFLEALQNNPGWALGGLVAVLLAGGVIGAGVKRRRRRAK